MKIAISPWQVTENRNCPKHLKVKVILTNVEEDGFTFRLNKPLMPKVKVMLRVSKIHQSQEKHSMYNPILDGTKIKSNHKQNLSYRKTGRLDDTNPENQIAHTRTRFQRVPT